MMLKGWVGCTHLCPQCAFVSLVYLSHLCGCLFKFLYISQGFEASVTFVWVTFTPLSHKLAGLWGVSQEIIWCVYSTTLLLASVNQENYYDTWPWCACINSFSTLFLQVIHFLWLCLCPHLWIANGSSRVIDLGWKFIWPCRFCIHIFVPSLTWKITAPCSSR